MTKAAPEPRHFTLYDGREPVGIMIGVPREWRIFRADGSPLPGKPYRSYKRALAALHAARPNPCAADARMDGS